MVVKEYLFTSILAYFQSARQAYEYLRTNPEVVKEIMKKGAAKAREMASKTMGEVRDAIGLTNKYSYFEY